jgi:hypothetical protein
MEWWQANLEEAYYASDYRVHVRYAESLEADIDFSDMLKHPFYEPLQDKKLFAQVRVDPETQVLVWPGEIDVAPEITFERAIQAAGKNL